jgi:hypothetical protein
MKRLTVFVALLIFMYSSVPVQAEETPKDDYLSDTVESLVSAIDNLVELLDDDF